MKNNKPYAFTDVIKIKTLRFVEEVDKVRQELSLIKDKKLSNEDLLKEIDDMMERLKIYRGKIKQSVYFKEWKKRSKKAR